MRLQENVDKTPHVPGHSSIHTCLLAASVRLPPYTAKVRLCLPSLAVAITQVSLKGLEHPMHPRPSQAPLRSQQ